MFRTATIALFTLALCAPAFAQKAAAQDATQAKPVPVLKEAAEEPQHPPVLGLIVPAAFAMQLSLFQEEALTFVDLAGNATHLGVLIASLDDKVIQFPGLPPILANPVILGCGVMEETYSFAVGKVPEGMKVYLQGVGLSLDGQIAATKVGVAGG